MKATTGPIKGRGSPETALLGSLSTRKNETILNVFLQGGNIKWRGKMANLGKRNPQQQVVGRRTMTPLHNRPRLPVMRSPRQLPHSSKEWGQGACTCVHFYGLSAGTHYDKFQLCLGSKRLSKVYEMWSPKANYHLSYGPAVRQLIKEAQNIYTEQINQKRGGRRGEACQLPLFIYYKHHGT